MTPLIAASSTGGAVFGSFLFVLFVLGVAAYFIPAIIALVRRKSNTLAIFLLNLFLGWSLIGWVVALVWAVSKDQQPVVIQQTFHPGARPSSVDDDRI